MNALEQAGKYVDAPQFYKYLHHRVEINFSLRNDPENEDGHVILELSRVSTYDQIAAKLGDHLKIDPTFLRFSTVSTTTGKPRSFVRRTQNPTLAAIVNPTYSTYGHLANQRNDWLFYEVLEMSLSELETKKLLKICYLSEGITKEVSRRIRHRVG